MHRHRRAGGVSCWLEGTLPMAWQQRAGHLRRDAELPAAPRCQRRSSPLPQAHERAVEKRKAEARESLMKVSRCPLVWVCSSSMEEAGGECGMELLSDGAS